ncbi:sugar phosphate isomerase/epimerase family protein [Halomonas organivorans]|uniref:Sugar phosphate isomerase/epimerase n=1 Tax=Halomonas organivorans TaxID=257772 RepID=A0A7W5BYZ5_9GAMM|nr:sugar phosphate isomerase/epimerase [Halomonas organivorans]MBB3141775.1 sugar phosphate isomerase/epimerase [Halomonas organivorans]
MHNNTTRPLAAFRRRALLACLGAALAPPGLAYAQAQDQAVAAQMYTLRDFGSLEKQFAAVERAGIELVELVGDQGIEADEMNALLARHDLEVVSSHVPLEDLRHDLDHVVAFHQAIGNDTLVIPYLAEDARPGSAEGWQALGEEIGGLANRLAEDDMRLAYHNHDFEMQTFDGRTALEILMEAAGPEVLGEVDLAWVARGGRDPADYLEHFDGRLFAVHAKDNAPAGTAEDQRGFAIVGQGVLDWDEILPAAREAGVEVYVIEHDQPKDAQAVLTEGHRFLSEALVSADAE